MKTWNRGFTLLEIIIALTVFAIMIGAMLPVFFHIDQRERGNKAIDILDAFQKGVTGNPVIILNEARTSFGYLGDMGNLPENLGDLYKKGSQPGYSFDSTLKVGAGWNGPYINPGIVEHMQSAEDDPFAQKLEYVTIPYTNSTVGQTVEARIRSLGADKTSGTEDDLSLEFFKTKIKSKVFGFIMDQGKRKEGASGVAGVTVTMNEPSGGVIIQKNTTTDTTGFYIFDDITYGNRSLTIEPKLVLTADSAKATGPSFDNVEFSVTNYSSNDIAITSLTQVLSISPPVYFKTLRIGNKAVYSSTAPRIGSGDTITFTAETLTGGGGVKDSVPIRIQSSVTEVEDLSLGNIGRGSNLTIQMEGFTDVQTGNGQAVDMSGVPFEVTLSDGSIIMFTPIAG